MIYIIDGVCVLKQLAQTQVGSIPAQGSKLEYASKLLWMKLQALGISGRLEHNKAILANYGDTRRYPTLPNTNEHGQGGSLLGLRGSGRFRFF